MEYLLDTDTCIDLLRGLRPVVRKLEKRFARGLRHLGDHDFRTVRWSCQVATAE